MRFVCDIRVGARASRTEHDSRSVARKTERVLADAEYDCSYWGPEIEFFVFDSVQLIPSAQAVRDAWSGAGYLISDAEAPWQTGPTQSLVRFKEGYHRTPPTTPSADCGTRCATS